MAGRILLLLLARLKVLMPKGERVMGIEPTYQAWEARVLPTMLR